MTHAPEGDEEEVVRPRKKAVAKKPQTRREAGFFVDNV
jgi:hypothetical protein